MADISAPKSARPWRVIAEEASREYDPLKMAELMRELNQALEEQGVIDPASEQLPHQKTA
jgi:hypothetical protein